MASSNFPACLKVVLVNEGGYVDDPRDSGGATRYGVTRATLSRWLHRPVSIADVRNLSLDEAGRLYRACYWDAVKGDQLPWGVDCATFDYAVNSGNGRAIRELQDIVGLAVDGVIGPETLRMVQACDADIVIRQISAKRLSFLERLRTWHVFGRGWAARVHRTEGAALAMVHHGTLAGLPPAA